MRFLFCLDLSLHAGAGNFFGILIFGTKHGVAKMEEIKSMRPAGRKV